MEAEKYLIVCEKIREKRMSLGISVSPRNYMPQYKTRGTLAIDVIELYLGNGLEP